MCIYITYLPNKLPFSTKKSKTIVGYRSCLRKNGIGHGIFGILADCLVGTVYVQQRAISKRVLRIAAYGTLFIVSSVFFKRIK